MDHLQQGQCNPASITYRDDIRKSVRDYLTKHQCPAEFTRQFRDALEWWLTSTMPVETGVQGSTDLWEHQNAVGWRLFTRGFLTRQWHNLLHELRSADNNPDGPSAIPSCEITKTIAGLITTMWGALSRAWLDHLAIVHEKQTKPTNSPVTLQSLKDRVRLIHALKAEVLPCHQHYFHDNIESVLQKATSSSLQKYIQHYLPCILRSIQTRQSTSHHPPFCPPLEYLPTSNHTSHPEHHTTLDCLIDPTTTPGKHPAQSEPTHRRHSRDRID